MGALDLAVQSRRFGPDIDVADVLAFQVPVEVGLELSAVVRLDNEHSEGEPADNLVYEADGGLLIADVVDLEYADASAVVDRRKLVEALSRSGDPLQEFHVNLQAMPWLRLLVSMPGTTRRLTPYVGRQPAHPVADQDAVDRRARHMHLVKAIKITGNPAGPKAISLAQIQDLGDHRAGSGSGKMQRRSGTIAETCLTVTLEPSFPFIEGLAREPIVPTSQSDPSRHLFGLTQHPQTPGYQSVLFILVHGLLLGWEKEPECQLRSETSQSPIHQEGHNYLP